MNIVSLAVIAVTAACAAAAGAADTPNKNETALRAQVQRFYDLQVQGKHRATEPLVCEASRDAYYSITKNTPRSVELRSVKLLAPNEPTGLFES